MKTTLSVIILTFNEEKNIAGCLDDLKGFAEEIFIVDSYSTDRTLEIASLYTDKIYQHPFETQARQFNWALDNLPVSGDWIMRIDADERVPRILREEIEKTLPIMPPDITGLYIKRRFYFLGRWIKHGDYYPAWILRLWRKGKARSEEQILNEHIMLLEGKWKRLKNDFIDHNQKNLSFWIEKHNNYSVRYAKELINYKYFLGKNPQFIYPSLFGSYIQRKKWIKYKVYNRFPIFIRSAVYFVYCYFFRLGFLDGLEGLIFHFLHSFWYHFLIDARIYFFRKDPKSKIDLK